MSTALQIVNSVMVRLRESTVTAFTDEYTKLILAFVNETMREVQNRHQWEALRKSITFQTVAAQQRYILTGDTNDTYGDVLADTDVITADSSLVFYVDPNTGRQKVAAWGFTGSTATPGTGYPLTYTQKEHGVGKRYMQNLSDSYPKTFYTYQSTESDSTVTRSVYFLEAPSAEHNITMTWFVPKADLTSTTDQVLIPDLPIILGAYTRALDERGEELGPQVGSAERKYQLALDEAVLQDQGDDTQIAVPE